MSPANSEEHYWQQLKEQHMLDPDGIYLNTGSFGSQPRRVFESLLEGLRTIEADPTFQPRGAHRALQRARASSFSNKSRKIGSRCTWVATRIRWRE